MARIYRINGQDYISVTTALEIIRKPFLERWRGSVGNDEADRIRDEAGDFGSAVHDACQAIDQGSLPNVDETVYSVVKCYEQWTQATVKEWLKIEDVVFCSHYWYAGRVDRVAILKGDRNRPTVIDLKTSTYISKEMGLQLAAYQHCLEDEGIKPKRRIILQLPKDPLLAKIKVHEFPDYVTDFRMFLYALELYRHFGGERRGEDVCIVNV